MKDPTIAEMAFKLGISKSGIEYRLRRLPDELRQSMIYFDPDQTRHLTEQGVTWLESLYQNDEEEKSSEEKAVGPLAPWPSSLKNVLASLEQQLQEKDSQLAEKDRQIAQLLALLDRSQQQQTKKKGIFIRRLLGREEE